jgi:hypothetical protein
MRKISLRDVTTAGSTLGRWSPAASAASEGDHHPFNMHPVDSPRKIRRHREVPFNKLGRWLQVLLQDAHHSRNDPFLPTRTADSQEQPEARRQADLIYSSLPKNHKKTQKF